MSKIKVSLSRAFTLIEMMFVIIIIAVLSLYFANFIQQRTNAQSAAETAGQIMQWLQASQNYYMQNLYWPQSTNGDGGWSVLYNGGYLPATEQCSKLIQNSSSTTSSCGLFGTFTVGYAAGNDASGQPYNYRTSQYISVSTPVANPALGQQIAAQISNGQYANGQVTGYANIPSANIPPNEYHVFMKGVLQAPVSQGTANQIGTGSSSQWYQLYGSIANYAYQPVGWPLILFAQGGSELDIVISNSIPGLIKKQVNTGVSCAYYGAYQYETSMPGVSPPIQIPNPFAGNNAQCIPCIPGSTNKKAQCTYPALAGLGGATSEQFHYTPPATCSIGALGSNTLGIQTGGPPQSTPQNPPSGGVWPPAIGISAGTFLNVINKTTGVHAANVNVNIKAPENCFYQGGPAYGVNYGVQEQTNSNNPFWDDYAAYESLLNGNTVAVVQPGTSLTDSLQTFDNFPSWGSTTNSKQLAGLNMYTWWDNNTKGQNGACTATITLTWMDPATAQCFQSQVNYNLTSTSVWTSVDTGSTATLANYCQVQLIQTQPVTQVKCPQGANQ